MAKAKPKPEPSIVVAPDLFAVARRDRKYRALILPRFLAEASTDKQLEGPAQNAAYEMVKKWADLEKSGELIKKKETAFDAQFLEEIFNRSLGYTFATDNPAKYSLERQFTVPGVGAADGALGVFGSGLSPTPFVMIELKGAKTDLDRDKSNGRTAVQQCWDYLNASPTCPWGIVSNFSVIRLYHRNKTPQAYQEFRLQDLRKRETFLQFYYLFEAGAFLPSPTGVAPRAVIAAFIPNVAVVNSAPLIIHGDTISYRRLSCLLGNLNSIAHDFVARQKVGALHLNFFIVEQRRRGVHFGHLPGSQRRRSRLAHPRGRIPNADDPRSVRCVPRRVVTGPKTMTARATGLVPVGPGPPFPPGQARWLVGGMPFLTVRIRSPRFRLRLGFLGGLHRLHPRWAGGADR